MLSNIYQKLISIACLRVVSIQKIFEALWSETKNIGFEHLDKLQENTEGIKMMANSIGTDVDSKDIFLKGSNL